MTSTNDISNKLQTCSNNLKLDNLDDIENTVANIAKKLNKEYYDLDDDTEHMHIVGSVGRKTAVKNNSDVDILFELSNDDYKRFDNYSENGQSALLQEVKSVLLETYPNTDIRGDGQVVVIGFKKYTIELVPAFLQNDNSFKYPNTHDGGSWKITHPFEEQEEATKCNNLSFGRYYKLCRLIRSWKNNIGFSFGGLLIDTLVYNYFLKNNYFKDSSNYFSILLNLFKYLSEEDKEKSYWLALGSNQQIDNKDNGAFVKKANKAYNKLLKAITDNNVDKAMYELLGDEYPVDAKYSKARDIGEQFITDKFLVDIRYRLTLNCVLKQDGFMPINLKDLLVNPYYRIKRKYNLVFNATLDNRCLEPYSVWWKVKNNGAVARNRNCLRGNLEQTNNLTRKETSNFYGNHYVECYIVKNEICVAKAHIDVPIDYINE